jgi:hypothetical protein
MGRAIGLYNDTGIIWVWLKVLAMQTSPIYSMILFDLSTHLTVHYIVDQTNSTYYKGILTITDSNVPQIHPSIPKFPHTFSIIPKTTAQSTRTP